MADRLVVRGWRPVAGGWPFSAPTTRRQPLLPVSVAGEVRVAGVMALVIVGQADCLVLSQLSFLDLSIEQVTETVLQEFFFVSGERDHLSHGRSGDDATNMVFAVARNYPMRFVGRDAPVG